MLHLCVHWEVNLESFPGSRSNQFHFSLFILFEVPTVLEIRRVEGSGQTP